MALTALKLDGLATTTNAGSYSFASHTYTANRLYVVFVNSSIASGTAPKATGVASAAVTFTEIGTAGGLLYSGTVRRLQAWWAVPGSTQTGQTVTITLDGTSTGMYAPLIEMDGNATTSPIVQSKTGSATSGTSITVTFDSAFGNSANRPLACTVHRAQEATTEDTAEGYTELDDGNFASPSAGGETQWHSTTASTTPSASWTTSTDNAMFALEIKAAASGSFTMTADVGTFSMTGQIALFNTTQLENNAVYSESGQTAFFNFNHLLANASFTLSGQTTIFAFDNVLDHGVFTLAGQDVLFMIGSVMIADVGTFSMAGQAALFIINQAENTGTFLESGQAVLFAIAMAENNGTYNLVGQDAAFLQGVVMTADAGLFSLAGQTSIFDLSVQMAEGGFIIIGQDAGLAVSVPPVGTDIKPEKHKQFVFYREPTERERQAEDMKMAEVLSSQLRQTRFVNQQLLEANKRMLTQLEQERQKISPPVIVVNGAEYQRAGEIPVATPVVPAKPPMDPRRKAELVQRLEKARFAKEAEKERQRQIAEQRSKNLAKARRVQKKNRRQ